MEGHWKFLGGRGVFKAKFLEVMYGNKLAFPWGRGVLNKEIFRVGSLDIFWNCTILQSTFFESVTFILDLGLLLY